LAAKARFCNDARDLSQKSQLSLSQDCAAKIVNAKRGPRDLTSNDCIESPDLALSEKSHHTLPNGLSL
jgi:hypothetical protein